jgi:protein-tyrosine phosphatase
MYQNFLEYGRKSIVQLVDTLGEHPGGLLYHCSAGEDRTGLVTAVLLSVVGVPDADILADHAQSLSLGSVEARGYAGAAATQRMRAPLNAMMELLQMIRTRWGTTEGYLIEAGASLRAVDAFRCRAIAAQQPTAK